MQNGHEWQPFVANGNGATVHRTWKLGAIDSVTHKHPFWSKRVHVLGDPYLYRDFSDLSPRSSRILPHTLFLLIMCYRDASFSCRLLYLPLLENARLLPLALTHRHRVVTASCILHFLDLSFRPQKALNFLFLYIILQKLSRSFAKKFKTDVKHCWVFFLSIFSSLTCLQKTCFQQAGPSAVEEGTTPITEGPIPFSYT